MIDDANPNIVDAKLSGGHEYRGSIQMNDTGYYKWSSETSYEGDFNNGRMTGFGVYKFKNGTYDGHVYDGLRHGYGTFILHDSNTKYIGEWEEGRRHGKGIIYYECGNNDESDQYYNGDWVNGKREGSGICVFENGDEYNGEWKNDCKHGKGIIRWKSFNEIYYGQWEHDKPHGDGIHLICNQGVSIDDVSIEQLEGQHNFTTLNGLNWYFGHFENGQRHGMGVYNYSNGSQYKGEWMENKKVCRQFLLQIKFSQILCILSAWQRRIYL